MHDKIVVINLKEQIQMSTDLQTKLKNKIGLIILLVVIIILGFSSFTIIDPGTRGVVVQLGSVKPGVLGEGIHFRIPFIQSIIPIEVRIQKEQTEQTAASKDLQNVSTSIA